MGNPAFAATTTRSAFVRLGQLGNSCAITPRRPRRSKAADGPTRCAANPNEALDTAGLAEWRKVSVALQEVSEGLSEQEADKMVGRAFGWSSQKFWRGDVKEERPELTQVTAALDFLRNEIGVEEKDFAAILKKFPEVVRLPVERMAGNKDFIIESYPVFKNGTMLLNVVKETPAVLGYDFDCAGDCKSECARCWVQF